MKIFLFFLVTCALAQPVKLARRDVKVNISLMAGRVCAFAKAPYPHAREGDSVKIDIPEDKYKKLLMVNAYIVPDGVVKLKVCNLTQSPLRVKTKYGVMVVKESLNLAPNQILPSGR